MQYLKNKWIQHQFYKITKEGDQIPMEDPCDWSYILHIHNGTYHFIHFMTNSYQRKLPTHPILGLSISISGVSYNLPVAAFSICGNELFTPPLVMWLCKHYLHITPPSSPSLVTVIDANVDVETKLWHRVE
jgi:hypothetical protein